MRNHKLKLSELRNELIDMLAIVYSERYSKELLTHFSESEKGIDTVYDIAYEDFANRLEHFKISILTYDDFMKIQTESDALRIYHKDGEESLDDSYYMEVLVLGTLKLRVLELEK